MLRVMFWPFFKKYLGLFFSMVFVSVLSVGLLCCFGSSLINTKKEYKEYINEYQDMDEIISTNFVKREKLLSINNIESIDKVDARLVVDAYVKKNDGRTIVGRVFTYDDDPTSPTRNQIFKRYIVNNVPYQTKAKNFNNEEVDIACNVGICQKFAKNNDFKLGDVLQFGFYNVYVNFYVAEIVETPEGIYPRANNYIWSDNHDFGYFYASEVELSHGLRSIANNIQEVIDNDPAAKEYYEAASQVAGITIPDLTEMLIDDHFASNWANQLMVKNKEDTVQDDVITAINKRLTANEVTIKSTTIKTIMPHIAYMDHALEQVQVASIFLPVFFYTVTMIVVGLFLNQIIKAMTPQIGVMMSIGVGNRDIVKLFLIFTALMAVLASLIGAPVGFALNIFMSKIMKQTYSIPTIVNHLNPWVVGAAVILLIIITLVTTMISCQRIFRITPKDATISNESKRKRLPKPIEKFIDKAPMNIKLGTNSIMQNPRRFFVSTFSMFASIILILLSTLFFVSKETMVKQATVERLNYDVQIYLTTEEDKDQIQTFYEDGKIKDDGTGFIKNFADCFYTYIKVDTPSDDTYLECLSFDPHNIDAQEMIVIPDEKGKGHLKVEDEGIILPLASAEKLKVKKGDNISVNGKSIKVTAISKQYFHPITYLSSQQLKALEVSYVSSYIMNITDDIALQDYLVNNRNQCLAVYSSSLSKDLHAIFDALNIMIYIMVAFSVGMAFIILTIMSQNALLEQQRQLTVFRAIGFTILDISNIWTLQSIAQLFFSALFGVPAGALSIYILLKLCSSASQTYPFIFSWPMVFMTLGFILLVLIACHLIAMRVIYKCNIADNTRCRE